jgi:hypothetical protein
MRICIHLKFWKELLTCEIRKKKIWHKEFDSRNIILQCDTFTDLLINLSPATTAAKEIVSCRKREKDNDADWPVSM